MEAKKGNAGTVYFLGCGVAGLGLTVTSCQHLAMAIGRMRMVPMQWLQVMKPQRGTQDYSTCKS